MNASVAAARAEGRTALTELEASALLAEYGLAVSPSRLASELEDEVREVDLNPVLVLPAGRGVVGVDALVALTTQ